MLAGQLQKSLAKLERHYKEKAERKNRLAQLQQGMEEAARNNDFVKAGRLQAQIKALQPTAGTAGGAIAATSSNAPFQEGDDASDDEGGDLAEAMANHPAFAQPVARANQAAQNAAMAGISAPHYGRQTHGLGKNVFAPPGKLHETLDWCFGHRHC